MRALSLEEAEALRDLALPDHPGKTLPADELLVVRGCARRWEEHTPAGTRIWTDIAPLGRLALRVSLPRAS